MDFITILLITLYLIIAVLFYFVFRMYKFCRAIMPRIEKFDNGINTVRQFLDKMQQIVLLQEDEINHLTEQLNSLNQQKSTEEPELWRSS